MAGQSEQRLLWWAAIATGVSYMVPVLVANDIYHIEIFKENTILLMLWKGAGVALLALWALRSVRVRDGKIIAAVLALGALGDVLIEAVGLKAGALAFAAGHVIAIAFYLRYRRDTLEPSQRALVFILIPAAIIIALSTQGPMGAVLERLGSGRGNDIYALLVYTALVSAMAASAWSSRFSRYRVGIGAMLFLLSDLLIFAGQGRLAGEPWPHMLIWPLYFGGQALIARGVVTTLQREGGRREAGGV